MRIGELKNIEPLFHRFVAGSSCFSDGGPESLEDDPTAVFEAKPCHAVALEIYFGSAAKEMPLENEAGTKKVAVAHWPESPADEKKCAAPATTFMQANSFESNGAMKPLPAASTDGDLDEALAYFEDPQLFGPGASGTSKRPLDPGGVGTSELPPDQG
jgi:hypothetical protein